MDKAKMLELFGSDSEASDDEPAPRSAAASSSLATDFEDDDAVDGEGEAVAEDDLFGGASDEEVESRPSEPQVPSGEPLHYELPELQCPSEEGHLYLVRAAVARPGRRFAD
jgi:RNA polymerase-associated protein LEO1